MEISSKMDTSVQLADYEKKWDARSSIRTRALKRIDFSIEGSFFPAEKQPLLLNDYVKSLGKKASEKILNCSLFKYLNDITNLEIKLINKVCNAIIYSNDIKFEAHHKTAAYTVLIDEYYHVYLAQLMKEQLAAKDPSLENLYFPMSDSYYAVQTVKKELKESYQEIFEILAVCIFETTLVRELVSFFNSKDVHPSIKYYVNDHMNDESRHYGYFYEILQYTWHALPSDCQTDIGFRIAKFVQLYLNITSDRSFNLNILSQLIQDEKKAQKIVDDIYKDFTVTPDIPIVKNVLSVLKKTGILSHPAVQSGFKEIMWEIN